MKFAHCLLIVFVIGKHTLFSGEWGSLLGLVFNWEDFYWGGKFLEMNFSREILYWEIWHISYTKFLLVVLRYLFHFNFARGDVSGAIFHKFGFPGKNAMERDISIVIEKPIRNYSFSNGSMLRKIFQAESSRNKFYGEGIFSKERAVWMEFPLYVG